MSHLRLDWQGPWSLLESSATSLFAAPVAAQRGFYVWWVPTSHGRLAYYVGETGAGFAARHRGHLESYSVGSYSIHSAQAMRDGRLEPVYSGFVYSKRLRAERLPEFQRRHHELEEELRACLECIEVYTAAAELSERVRRRVETAILDAILVSRSHLAGFEKEKWSRRPRLPEEDPIIVTCTSSLPLIQGLSQVEA